MNAVNLRQLDALTATGTDRNTSTSEGSPRARRQLGEEEVAAFGTLASMSRLSVVALRNELQLEQFQDKASTAPRDLSML
jgi:hypothetical protein